MLFEENRVVEIRRNVRFGFSAVGGLVLHSLEFVPFGALLENPFGSGILAPAVEVGAHYAEVERQAVLGEKLQSPVDRLPIVFALHRLQLCPFKPEISRAVIYFGLGIEPERIAGKPLPRILENVGVFLEFYLRGAGGAERAGNRKRHQQFFHFAQPILSGFSRGRAIRRD